MNFAACEAGRACQTGCGKLREQEATHSVAAMSVSTCCKLMRWGGIAWKREARWRHLKDTQEVQAASQALSFAQATRSSSASRVFAALGTKMLRLLCTCRLYIRARRVASVPAGPRTGRDYSKGHVAPKLV